MYHLLCIERKREREIVRDEEQKEKGQEDE